MELGSNFELDISNLKRVDDSIFEYLKNYYSIYLDSGRSAIKLLKSKLGCGTILLPSYICESVIDVFRQDFQIEFYQVTKELEIDLVDFEKKIDRSTAAVYLMHYFGQIQNQEVLSFLTDKRDRYGFLIIEDTTHSIFTSAATIGDYCICSLRKWFPIPDGGVVYSKFCLDAQKLERKIVPSNLEAMILKYLFIYKNVPCNHIYRQVFQAEERKLDYQDEIYELSEISSILLSCYSIQELKTKRKKNAEYLFSRINRKQVQPVLREEDDTPLTFPVYVKNRDSLKRFLSENRIYCAVHWPIEDMRLKQNDLTVEISKHILSLPIDQRYGGAELDYLLSSISKYYEKNGMD